MSLNQYLAMCQLQQLQKQYKELSSQQAVLYNIKIGLLIHSFLSHREVILAIATWKKEVPSRTNQSRLYLHSLGHQGKDTWLELSG